MSCTNNIDANYFMVVQNSQTSYTFYFLAGFFSGTGLFTVKTNDTFVYSGTLTGTSSGHIKPRLLYTYGVNSSGTAGAINVDTIQSSSMLGGLMTGSTGSFTSLSSSTFTGATGSFTSLTYSSSLSSLRGSLSATTSLTNFYTFANKRGLVFVEANPPSASSILGYFDNFLGAATCFFSIIARNGNTSISSNLGTAFGGTMALTVQCDTTAKTLQVSVTAAATVNWSIMLL